MSAISGQLLSFQLVFGPEGECRHPDCYDCVSHNERGPGAVGRESNMTIYISQGRYTAAAIRAMTTKPEDRSEAIAALRGRRRSSNRLVPYVRAVRLADN